MFPSSGAVIIRAIAMMSAIAGSIFLVRSFFYGSSLRG